MAKQKTRSEPKESPLEKDELIREKPAQDGIVRRGVLAALGQPPGLYDVSVRALWGNHYRVNVLIGSDATSVRIAHSYFIQASVGGDILSAIPQITRVYT